MSSSVNFKASDILRNCSTSALIAILLERSASEKLNAFDKEQLKRAVENFKDFNNDN